MGTPGKFTDSALFRVSLGMLVVMGGGLVSGASYIATLSASTSQNSKDIAEIRIKQSAMDQIQTDIAVIRSKVENIETSVNRREERQNK